MDCEITAVEVEEGSVKPSGSVLAPAEDGPKDGLNDQQRAFCQAFIDHRGNIEQAASAAGYRGGAANMGTRNLAKPKIQAEIARRLRLQAGSALAKALDALFRVIETSTDHKAVVQAALGIMDRFGMAPPKGPAVAVQVNNLPGSAAQTILMQVMQARQRRLTVEGAA